MNILGITFLAPLFLLGIFAVPVCLYVYYRFQKRYTPTFSTAGDIQKVFGKSRGKFALEYILLFCILSLFFILFANPNLENQNEEVQKNGIDIVIVFDVSESMLVEDMQPNRLEEAKKVVQRFIEKQETNRVGLVLFAGKPFTSIPLTFDYNILTETVERINTDMVPYGKTAIGDAILAAKNSFEQVENTDEKREKVIILLTDGDANRGINPNIAAIRAKEQGIKIYTIGIGSEKGGEIQVDMGPFSQKVPIPPLNATELKNIAKQTGGEFYRATDTQSFQNIFKKLESLEKHDITVEVETTYTDLYDEVGKILAILLCCYFFVHVGVSYIPRP